mgnify:CR=1 FL=1
MRSLLDSPGGKLEQVNIHDIRESTFFAKLIVRIGDRMEEIDARPSDGIALALRTQTPIYVSDKIVLEEASGDKRVSDESVPKIIEALTEALAESSGAAREHIQVVVQGVSPKHWGVAGTQQG